MKVCLFVIMFLIAATISGIAGAEDLGIEYKEYLKMEKTKTQPFMSFTKPALTREDAWIMRNLGKHSSQTCNEPEIHKIGDYVYNDRFSKTERVNDLLEAKIQIPEKERYAKNN